MTVLPTHPRYSFIVRIWFELEPTLEGYAPALRGSVQRPGSEQVHYFYTFDKLIGLLEQTTEQKDNQIQTPLA
jgi:hypothetical protein